MASLTHLLRRAIAAPCAARSTLSLSKRLLPPPPASASRQPSSAAPRALRSRVLHVRSAYNQAAGYVDPWGSAPEDGGGVPPLGEVEWSRALANRISLIGHCGRDVEVRQLESGSMVARVSFAVSKGKDVAPDWYDLEFWDNQAALARLYVQKGKRFHVEGRMVQDQWTDKMTGATRFKCKVVVELLQTIRDDLNRNAMSQPQAMQQPRPVVPEPSSVPQSGGLPPPPMPQAPTGTSNPMAEEKWRQFFVQPDAYWDNRLTKFNPKAPDFKHKDTGAALWVESFDRPAWVLEELQKWDAQQGQTTAASPQSYDAPQQQHSYGAPPQQSYEGYQPAEDPIDKDPPF